MIGLDDVEDPQMLGCVRRAQALYMATNPISHEGQAWALGDFLMARLRFAEDTGQPCEVREGVAALVRYNTRIAVYFSSGRRSIVQALSCLLRLALDFADHPDYRPEWGPLDRVGEPC